MKSSLFWVQVLQEKGTRSNVLPKMEVKNITEVAKVETNEIVNPISEHEPSILDAPPKGELMYILVIQLIVMYKLVYSNACVTLDLGDPL